MKHVVFAIVAVLILSDIEACGSSPSADTGGESGGGAVGNGGVSAGGGVTAGDGAAGNGGASGSGGAVSSGGRDATGGQSGGGATGALPGGCPYTVASFSCDGACAKLHDFYGRCQNDPQVPAELQAMLGLYGQVEVICTSTCAVVAPASQAQWACFQGIPDGAPCAAIAGCNATNCP